MSQTTFDWTAPQAAKAAQSHDEAYRAAFDAVRAAEQAGERGLEVDGQCQACFRSFTVKPVPKDSRLIDTFTRRGKMGLVIHGYERPGTGHIHGMCWGAGHPPYELSCELTKEWKKGLEGTLPSLRKNLDDLRSGKIKKFLVTHREWNSTGKGGYGAYEDHEVWVTEGEPLPENYPKKREEPNFPYLRKRAIEGVEDDIKSTISTIEMLGKRIAEWRYAPDKLIPRTGDFAALSGRLWFEQPKVQEMMKKLPAPDGGGKTFIEWALKFPRTMAWLTRTGGRTPSYYRVVKEAFDKRPEAVAAGLAATPEQKKAASLEARKSMSADKRKKEEDRDAKEVHVKNVLATLLTDPGFSAYLKRKSAKNDRYTHSRGYGFVGKPGEGTRAVDALPGEKNLYEEYNEDIKAAEELGLHGDRMYSLKRTATDLKSIASNAGFKIKIPKAPKGGE